MLEKIKEKFKNAFKSMKEDVIQNDDGAELLEILIGIALVAVVVIAVFAVITIVRKKGEDAGKAIEDITWGTGTGASS